MLTTTMNIHLEVFAKITQTAEMFKKSRKEIIIQLLKKMMKNHHLYLRGFTTVKYQSDAAKECWHCFHIRFKPDENEFFVDLRKFCKFSVSCLLAMAVKRYLGDLVKEVEGKCVDKYICFSNYVKHREVVNGIISWKLFWGYPEEHLKTLKL